MDSQTVDQIPYIVRYRLLKQYKQSLNQIEVIVSDKLRQYTKSRLQPNNCYKSAMQFVSVTKWHYCIGYFVKSLEPHAWAELDDVVFDGTLQAFYDKDQYYKARGLVKVITRDFKSAIDLGVKYGFYGLYPEDQEILQDYI